MFFFISHCLCCIKRHVFKVNKKYSKKRISDFSEDLSERKCKMESLFSNTFSDDEILSELYEKFFKCPANQWSVRLNKLADKMIIEPRRAIHLDGAVYLKDNQFDEFIIENIYKYLQKLKKNLINDKSLHKYQNTAFQAISQEFLLFVRYDYDQKSLEGKYLEAKVEETDTKESDDDTRQNNEEPAKGLIIIPTGSFFEGFSAPYEFKELGFSFGSDLDFLLFPEYYTGTEDLEQAKSHFFRVIYSKSYIGYVKLKINLDCFNSLIKENKPSGWLPKEIVESEGSSVGIDSRSLVKHLFPNDVSHGPALLVNDEGEDKRNESRVFHDFVYCLHLVSWPTLAQHWICRERLNGWPAVSTIKRIVLNGCHVVPIGVPNKTGRGPEWRLSFSAAEIELAHSLSESMVSVYGLFKYLMKNEITKQLEIKSYYLKNLFFWACEGKPQDFWKRENLALCLVYLMEKLEDHLKKGELPHYFVPENNLFTFEEPKTLMRNANIIHGMKHNAFVFAPFFLMPRIISTGLCSLLPPNIVQSQFVQ